MKEKAKELLKRCDFLLIILTVLTSILLYHYFSQDGQESRTDEKMIPIALQGSDKAQEDDREEVDAPLPKPGNPVRFLMYNLQNYFVQKDPQRSPHHRSFKPVAEREAVADNIAAAKPQVVGLVEIGGRAALQDLANRLAARGLNYSHGYVLERCGEDRALGILSAFPITANHSVAEQKLVGRTDKRMLRGLLDVTIATPDHRRFRIVGVHLKSRVANDPEAADAQRNREARTVAEHVHRVMKKHPNLPLLLYGDWNAGPTESVLSILTHGIAKGSSLRRLTPCDSRGESWTLYYRANNEYCTFDQIYVNSVLYRRMGHSAGMGVVEGHDKRKHSSDHRAVWCDLR